MKRERLQDSTSASHQGVGKPEDIDLTPKPLRVSKRKATPETKPSVHNTSRPPSSSRNLRMPVPINESSSLTQDQLVSPVLFRSSPVSPRDDRSLKVRKQRRHEPPPAIDAAVRKSITKAKERIMQPPTSKRASKRISVSSGSTFDETSAAGSARSSRSGVVSGVHGLKSMKYEALEHAPVDSRATQRRAVTDVEAFARQHAPSAKLRRGPSLKQRLVSRVLSGISNKSSLQPTIEDEERSVCPPSDEGQQQKPRSSSSRSIAGTELSDLLAAFPEPPANPVNSSGSTEDSFATPKSQSHGSRELSSPVAVPMLRPEIRFTPEFDNVSFEKGESMFVSLDFKAALSASENWPIQGMNGPALEVAVIVHNDSHTSPSSLMAHCETVRFLASNLDPDTDKVAVISTSAQKESHIVIPLTSPKPSRLKSALDSISAGSSELEHLTLASSLDMAQNILVERQSPTKSEEAYSTYGHIFLFTTHMDDTFNQFKLNDKLTLHMICAASLPRDFDQWPQSNGWKLRSLTGREPKVGNLNQRDNSVDDLFKDIVTLLSQARTGFRLGCLTNVDWDFLPGKDCAITEVLGKKTMATMQPGEVQTLIIRVRCKQPKIAEAWLSGRFPDPDDSDVFAEIEKMLTGSTTTSVLGAAASYNHPMLPGDTACSIIGRCAVRRFITTPGSPKFIKRPKSELESSQRVTVQRRLAYHYYTQLRPREAISALNKVIEEGHGRMACPNYVALLMKEQQFQARANRRNSLMDSPIKSAKSSPLLRQQNTPSTNPRNSIARSKVSMESPLAHRRLSEQKENRAISAEHRPDAARRIWSDLRLQTKPNGIQTSINNLDADEKSDAINIRETALKNRRSIGADTVRSLSSSLKGSFGLTAPWL